MRAKTPHRPERCKTCQHGVPCNGSTWCALNDSDLTTNKKGEPWTNWVCPRHQPKRKKP